MSRLGVYDNWGKLVGAVIDREKRDLLARCDSLSSTSSTSDASLSRLNSISSSFDYAAAANGEILPTSNLKIYTFANLKKASKNFKSDMVLGEGGFGTVYKGWVDEKTLMPSKSGTRMMVAVNKLNLEVMQGFNEWQTEVNFLGRLQHPNLVKLLGYCCEDGELVLVYEFMNKGSLENHLFRRNAASLLSWDIRLKVAIGAARGLTFLHTSEKKFIYRDFKASNILLDGSYNAKLSDFGLAQIRPSCRRESHVTTQVIGTYGYAAPEYIATGHLYVKSDVYGFGVVLLELMTGLRAFDTNRPAGKTELVDWMKPLLRSRRTLIDARIEGEYAPIAVIHAAQLTLQCLEPEPKNRPSMKEVLEVLEQIAAFEKPKESMSRSGLPSSSHQHRQSLLYPR